MMSERSRKVIALAGIAWWLSSPFAYLAEARAKWQYECSGRTFNGSFDDCFNDALPIFELLAFPLTFLLAYPFARLAFSMLAPNKEDRSFKWRFAASKGGSAYYPTFQIIAAMGVIWASIHLASLPLAVRDWYLFVYWTAWIGWFLTGAWVSLPEAVLPKIRSG